jgi:hypothetical protein
LRDDPGVKTLPRQIGPRPQLTGLGCPSCPGVLEVQLLGADYVEFRCRIGHVFAIDELVMAKEQALDGALDSGRLAIEELVQLLREARRLPWPVPARVAAARLSVLEGFGRALNDLQAANAPVLRAGDADASSALRALGRRRPAVSS